MPVNLNSIPPKAKRSKKPSMKIWSYILSVFLLAGGLFNYFITRNDPEKLISLYVVTVFSSVFFLALILRLISYFISEHLADGWDFQRHQDIELEIKRGQRYVSVVSQALCLPHIVDSRFLISKISTDDELSLPVHIKDTGSDLSYQSQFDDKTQIFSDRCINRIRDTLLNESMVNGLNEISNNHVPTVALLIDTDTPEYSYGIDVIHENLNSIIKKPFKLISQYDLLSVDSWMDSPDITDYLLVVSLRLYSDLIPGSSEAATSILFSLSNENCRVALHRPEFYTYSDNGVDLNESINKALLWGRVDAEEVDSIWLTGTGFRTDSEIKNSVMHSLASIKKTASQIIISDDKTGTLSSHSCWVNICIAAMNAKASNKSQLAVNIIRDENIISSMVISNH